jgi:hypothetical protein
VAWGTGLGAFPSIFFLFLCANTKKRETHSRPMTCEVRGKCVFAAPILPSRGQKPTKTGSQQRLCREKQQKQQKGDPKHTQKKTRASAHTL